MHLAGYKIRAWREAHKPPLSAEEFGIRFGDPWPSRTVYGWESKGKVARPPVQRRLADLGICAPEDWLEPAPEQDTEGSSIVSQNDQLDRDTREHPFFDMRQHGMVRVATSTPKTRTADIDYNVEGILAEAERAHDAGVDLVAYPELCVSSYAIDDLHLQSALLDAAEAGIARIVAASADIDPVLLIGAPLRHNGRVYNCAAAIAGGRLLGVVPKSFLPNYREYYEKRWFAHGREIKGLEITVAGLTVPFGVDLIFSASNLSGFKLHVEICEDYWAPTPPSTQGALAGATVLANLSASNITIGKSDERHLLARAQSSRAVAAYLYCASGHGESTTDLAWDGQGMIYEMGDCWLKANASASMQSCASLTWTASGFWQSARECRPSTTPPRQPGGPKTASELSPLTLPRVKVIAVWCARYGASPLYPIASTNSMRIATRRSTFRSMA